MTYAIVEANEKEVDQILTYSDSNEAMLFDTWDSAFSHVEAQIGDGSVYNIVEYYDGMSISVSVQRMYRFESDRPLKAFADIIINDALLIKGIKVLEGKHGLFVSMPQEQAKDKKWYDCVRCLTKEAREYITTEVLLTYNSGLTEPKGSNERG